VAKGILREDIPGAKRPSYSIRYSSEDISECFSDVAIEKQDGFYVLTATYKGNTPVRERLQSLDAERFAKGDLSLENLLDKYCSYINMYP
jgi:hypothetical protein